MLKWHKGGGDNRNEQAVDNPTDPTPVQMPETPPAQVNEENVRELRDAFKSKTFIAIVSRCLLHPVHKAAYDELAQKNGGPRFSLRPALSD